MLNFGDIRKVRIVKTTQKTEKIDILLEEGWILLNVSTNDETKIKEGGKGKYVQESHPITTFVLGKEMEEEIEEEDIIDD